MKKYGKGRKTGRRRMGGRKKSRGTALTGQLTKNAMVRPDKLRVKLPYVDYYTITAPVGGSGITRSFNINSIFDPDRTGIGHQPLGHDEWNIFYSRYRVYGVSYEIALTNLTADTSLAGGLTTTPYVPPAAFGDVSTFEQPRTRKFTLGNREGVSMYKMRGYIKLPAIIGQTNEQYRTDDDNVALFNSNPANQSCLNLSLLSLNTLTSATVQMYVRIVYHVELLDANSIGVSVTKLGQSPEI